MKEKTSFQQLILSLDQFWAKQGCTLLQPYDMEVGAGTFHPATFFGALGPHPANVAYVQPTRRPTDGRFGDNPLRTQHYYQYQVILKPSPDNVQELYLKSLSAVGIDFKKHDLRFVQDDWESPTLGASGLGWEVWLDSLEVTQFTYFQQMGGYPLDPISCEITYGLERICMFLQNEHNLFELVWSKDKKYGDIHKKDEQEYCEAHFNVHDIQTTSTLFELHEKEAERLLERSLLMPGFDEVIKISHLFNLLDARGAVSVTERAALIGRVRKLAKRCADLYMENGAKR